MFAVVRRIGNADLEVECGLLEGFELYQWGPRGALDIDAPARLLDLCIQKYGQRTVAVVLDLKLDRVCLTGQQLVVGGDLYYLQIGITRLDLEHHREVEVPRIVVIYVLDYS